MESPAPGMSHLGPSHECQQNNNSPSIIQYFGMYNYPVLFAVSEFEADGESSQFLPLRV